MVVKTYKLPDDQVDYLQMLDYEIGGLQVLHTHALGAGLPKEVCDKIKEEFQAKFAEYQIAKDEICSPYMAEYPMCVWHVSFQEGVLYIEDKQGTV